MLLADGKGPSAARISEIVWQLNRIASLPHGILASPECSVFNLSKIQEVTSEPLFSLKKSEQNEKKGPNKSSVTAGSGNVAMGGAAVASAATTRPDAGPSGAISGGVGLCL